MATRKKPGSLVDAVSIGELEGLRRLRDVLASEIEAPTVPNPQLPALAHQLRDVMARIATLEKSVVKGSVVDDLASRRVERRSAVGKGRTVAGGKGGVERAGSD